MLKHSITARLILALTFCISTIADFTLDTVISGSVDSCEHSICEDAYNNGIWACPVSDEGCKCYDGGFWNDFTGGQLDIDFGGEYPVYPSSFTIGDVCGRSLAFYHNSAGGLDVYNSGVGIVIGTCSPSGGGDHYCWDGVGSTVGSRDYYCSVNGVC